jgi:hypothetical protein
MNTARTEEVLLNVRKPVILSFAVNELQSSRTTSFFHVLFKF